MITADQIMALHHAAVKAAMKYQESVWGTTKADILEAAWVKAEATFEAAVRRFAEKSR